MSEREIYTVSTNKSSNTTSIMLVDEEVMSVPWCYDSRISKVPRSLSIEGVQIHHYNGNLIEAQRGWSKIGRVTNDGKLFLGRRKYPSSQYSVDELLATFGEQAEKMNLDGLDYFFTSSATAPIMQAAVYNTEEGLKGIVAATPGNEIVRACQSLIVVTTKQLQDLEFISRLQK